MNCAQARDLTLERQARRLSPELERGLEAHLAGCGACERAERAERELTGLLATRLPRAPAPVALVRRIAALAPAGGARPAPAPARARWGWVGGALAAVAAAVAVAVWSGARPGPSRQASLQAEAVSDHLRILVAQRPLEIESGGVHQVKPWFEGRLDFAPVVPDLAAAGLALRGGAVGYFVDRRAAVLQYQLRAHRVTLLVFRPEGLPLAEDPRVSAGEHGFRAAVWRTGALGYALVADVDPRELERVASEVARAAQ